MTPFAVLAQAMPPGVEALERIATAQLVIAVVMVVLGLIVAGGAVVLLLQVRAARRQLRAALNELRPQLAPLMDRAKHVTDDVSGMTDNVRRKVDDVLHTVEELRRSLDRGRIATEERAARFAAVLDVVQTEAEELMIDAAAAAHGMQETARVLREPRHTHRPRRPAGEPEQRHEDDEEELV
jgi:methyl-accepting chemotaxis protein